MAYLQLLVLIIKLSTICCMSLPNKTCKKEWIWPKIFPCNYDKFVAPTVNGAPVNVYINLQIMDVDQIKEDTMDFRMHLFLTEFWRDPRMNLNILNVTSFLVVPEKISDQMWIPDVVFDNCKWGQIFQFSLANAAIEIRFDEAIKRITRYSFIVSCPMLLHDYPIDIQECDFKIGFLTTSEEFGILQWSGDSKSPFKDLGESILLTEDIHPSKYEMEVPKPYRITEQWLDGNFSFLIAKFRFTRRLTGIIVKVYIPSTLVVFLSWLSFWIDVHAVPARITLGVTSILTLITQVAQSSSHMPSVNYIKALDIWLFICTSTVTASLVEYAIAYHYAKTLEKVDKIEHLLTNISKNGTDVKWAVKCKHCNGRKPLHMNIETNAASSAVSKQKNKTCCKSFLPKASTNNFDYYSRIIFPLTFMIFALVYWTYYIQQRSSYSTTK